MPFKMNVLPFSKRKINSARLGTANTASTAGTAVGMVALVALLAILGAW